MNGFLSPSFSLNPEGRLRLERFDFERFEATVGIPMCIIMTPINSALGEASTGPKLRNVSSTESS